MVSGSTHKEGWLQGETEIRGARFLTIERRNKYRKEENYNVLYDVGLELKTLI